MKTHVLIVCLLTTVARADPFPVTPDSDRLLAAVLKERNTNAFPPAPSSKELVKVAVKEIKARAEVPRYEAIKAPTAAKVAAGRIRSTRWVEPVPETPEYRVTAYQAQTTPEPVVPGRQLAGWPGLARDLALPVVKLPTHPPGQMPADAAWLLPPKDMTPYPGAQIQIPGGLRTIVSAPLGNLSGLADASQTRSFPGIEPIAVDPFKLKVELLWNKPHGQYMNQMLKDIADAKAKGDTARYNELTKRYTAWAEKYLRTEADAAKD